MSIYSELWSPKPLEIPRRSRLFCLEPIAVGTPYTESLSSYLNRLAQEHCLTSQKLIMGEIAPLILKDEDKSELLSKNISHLLGNSDVKPAINGMREMTGKLVTVLEELTIRQDLRFLTLLSWKGMIYDKGLFRNYRAWCPCCWEEWEQTKKTLYEPLLWSFKDVEFCLIHKQRLIEECPHCGSRLPAMARFSPAGFCSRCYGWLGQEIKGEEEIEKYRVNIQGIGELIALTPQLGYTPIPIELTRKLQLILLVFEQAIGKDLKLLGDLGVIMESLRIASTTNQSQPYHLVKLIIPVCQKAKISVSQLFGSDFKELGQILFGNFSLELKL
ncbi:MULTISPECIES: TniQ family protein [Cyanophyceae]|uniref:TniQ family protein n=1 Tax=Cyanophyceae TaxID=3028117 RepID=UPI0016821018|nr:TniQ family protein [Trichocoleus sp. FACHB-40]MBD2003608.1 TniQ family protein [Trichocoleus sp. FACHB-40]